MSRSAQSRQPIRALMVMPRDGVFRGIIRGFHAVAATRGWCIDLGFRQQINDDLGQSIATAVRLWRPDVLVLNAVSADHVGPELLNGRIAVSAEADLSGRGLASVVVDNNSVGRAAAEHLLTRGFRHVAAYGLATLPFALQRAEAFRAVATAGGAHYHGWPDVGPDGNGQDAAHVSGSLLLPTSSAYWVHRSIGWLAGLPRPVGILACCDLWGQQLLGDCALAGIAVPEEVAVVGVDDDELVCNITQPPLSSVHVPWERLGSELAALVQRLLDGEPPPPRAVTVAAGSVVARRSSDVIAVDDPDVAAALTFIQASANRPIGLPDILRVVPTYRERLQRAFRRTLGRTVMQEVHRIHVERAKQLLASTDWPTDRVAEHSGLENAVKLAVVFRKFAGQTPSAYRRQLRVSVERP